jgi:small subunit ribosomal protein S27e
MNCSGNSHSSSCTCDSENSASGNSCGISAAGSQACSKPLPRNARSYRLGKQKRWEALWAAPVRSTSSGSCARASAVGGKATGGLGFFMQVKHPGCTAITTVFSHTDTSAVCAKCSFVLGKPPGANHGGCSDQQLELTDGCSFRKIKH